MARKNHMDDLIHCEVCGEDYSPTYRRCPFCGEKPAPRPDPGDDGDEDDGYVFDGQDLFDDVPQERASGSRGGGKRLASGSSRRPSGGGRHTQAGPTSWIRLVTYLISLVIIIAAIIIVFTVIYPKLHKNPNPGPSATPSPIVSQEPDPSGQPSDQPTGEPTADPSDQPTAAVSPLNGITLDTYDFTLREGESYTIKATLNPADWDGELTWASSDTSYATVDSSGKVTNVNPTTSLRRVTITVTGGGQSVDCTVYCRGTNSGATAPPVVTGNPDSDTLAPGTKGVIVGAASGLRVRSGPGTTYEVLASLRNGDQVTIVESAGSGWYKITYGGSSTGYIMGQYISAQ